MTTHRKGKGRVIVPEAVLKILRFLVEHAETEHHDIWEIGTWNVDYVIAVGLTVREYKTLRLWLRCCVHPQKKKGGKGRK